MKPPAAQAAAFYRRVARDGFVWTLRDAGGFPVPTCDTGRRAQPFWSSSFRVLRMIRTVPDFAGYEPVRISWQEFRDRWLPGLDRCGLLVGVNWSGPKALGYDLDPPVVLALVERAMQVRAADDDPAAEQATPVRSRSGARADTRPERRVADARA